MKIIFRLLVTPFVLVLFVCCGLSAQAQQVNNAHDKQMLDSLLTSENLDTLHDFPVTLFSRGYGVRAKAVQNLVKSCIRFYQAQFPGDLYKVQIEILNEKDWKTLPFPHPYGFPHFTDINQSIIVSADKNALNRLNKMDDQQSNDSITAGYDYVALHELGHYFFFTLHQINKEHWLNETLASYYMICFLKENHLLLDIGKENIAFSVKYKTLEDFEKLYFRVGPQNYDWYQRRLIDLGFLLYPQLKTKLIQDVLINYNIGGKNLDALTLMKDIDPPVMNEWLKEMQ